MFALVHCSIKKSNEINELLFQLIAGNLRFHKHYIPSFKIAHFKYKYGNFC